MNALNTNAEARGLGASRVTGGRRRIGGTGVANLIRSVAAAVKPPVADLDAMERRREELNSRLLVATAQVDEARAHRRDLYLAEEVDEVALTDAENMLRTAESRLAGVQEAAAAIAERITAAHAEEAARLGAAERERVAAEIEARAERVTSAAVELDRKAEGFDEARKALIETVRTAMIVAPGAPGSGYAPAGPMLDGAARLAGVTPRSEIDGLLGRMESAYHGAHQHVEAMKRLAADIRAGTAAPLLPGPLYVDVRPSMPVETTRIVLSRPVSYQLLGHGQILTLSGNIEVPVPVAQAARDAGIGFDPLSVDGKAIQAALQRRGNMADTLKRAERGVWVPDKGEPNREGGPPIAPEAYLDLGLFD